MHQKLALAILFIALIAPCFSQKSQENIDEEPATNYGRMLSMYDDDNYYNPSYFGPNMTMEPEAKNGIASTILVVVYTLISVVGLVANGVVFFVIFGSNEISKMVTATYVVQLAVADSAFLIAIPIFAIDTISRNWKFGKFVCILCQTVKYLNYFAGIFFLTAMSVDRYIAVAYSTKAHQLRTKKRTMIVCAIVWVAAVIMCLPVTIFSNLETIEDETKCNIIFPGYAPYNPNMSEIDYSSYDEYYYMVIETNATEDKSGLMNNSSSNNHTELNKGSIEASTSTLPTLSKDPQGYQLWLIIIFFIGFLLPLSIILVCYVLILVRLYASEDRIASSSGRRTQYMTKKVTFMVAALVTCFVICWLPYHAFKMAQIIGITNISPTALSIIEKCVVGLAFSNSAINPILYTFLGHNFRQRLHDSIVQTKRRLCCVNATSSGVSIHPTKSHSDQQRHSSSLPRRISQMVGFRRGNKNSSGTPCQERSGENGQPDNGKVKHGIPLLDMNKKNDWKHDKTGADQVDCISATQSSPTEITRVTLEKEISAKEMGEQQI